MWGQCVLFLKISAADHLLQNKMLYFLAVFVYTAGVASGAFIADSETSNGMIAFAYNLQNNINSAALVSIDHLSVLKSSILQNVQVSIALWAFGLHFLVLPMVFLVLCVRGFLSGFTVGFFIRHFGFDGLALSVLCFVPQSLVFVPCMLRMAVTSLRFGINGFKAKKTSISDRNESIHIREYSREIILLFALLIISSIIEAFLTPLLLILSSAVFDFNYVT